MSKTKRIPTIDDVAEVAGVSKRTVSRVINKSELVKARTREKVEQVIQDLNYRPNRHARGLASSRSYMIGLVYDVPTLHIADIQKGILNVAYETGFELVVHACHIQTENLVDEVLEFVARTKVDGVIVLPPVSEVKELGSELENMGCHYVEFSSELSAKPWKQVVTNYLPAITDMTSHLVKLGHRKFAYISGPRSSVPSRKRQQAFSKALRQNGLTLPRSMIVEGAFTHESGINAAKKLLSRKDRPTAVFAGNDEMAIGLMNVANKMGIAIPEDLSVVGFDGTVFANFVMPSLSTIRRPSNTMSELGAKKLIARICEGRDAARAFEVMVSPQYAPGESTGPAPKD